MTQDKIVNQWEQDQELLRRALKQLGHPEIQDKQPDSGWSSAEDPHEWWDAEGTRVLASFYSEAGELTLHEPGCAPEVIKAFASLRDAKSRAH